MLSGERSMHVDTSPLHHSTTPPFGPLAADRERDRWRRGGLDALQPHWSDWWAGVPVGYRDYHPRPHPHLPPLPFSHPHPHPHIHLPHLHLQPRPSRQLLLRLLLLLRTTTHIYIHGILNERPAPGFESQGMSHRPPCVGFSFTQQGLRFYTARTKERAHLRPLCPTRKGAVEGGFVASGS